ncbi:hypothetical protein GGR52DRAFT_565537 [Hypoxylon sp. FL1284]|nr:hypothetical protein GGR52DRAFT_565537 [Hypoxylon sp. FL1284]
MVHQFIADNPWLIVYLCVSNLLHLTQLLVLWTTFLKCFVPFFFALNMGLFTAAVCLEMYSLVEVLDAIYLLSAIFVKYGITMLPLLQALRTPQALTLGIIAFIFTFQSGLAASGLVASLNYRQETYWPLLALVSHGVFVGLLLYMTIKKSELRGFRKWWWSIGLGISTFLILAGLLIAGILLHFPISPPVYLTTVLVSILNTVRIVLVDGIGLIGTHCPVAPTS